MVCLRAFNRHSTINTAGVGALALALAGCASTTPPPVVAPPPAKVAVAPSQEGMFKIGKPYQIDGKWYYPAEDYGYVGEGVASWYGQDFQGKRTANGEVFDMNTVSAAHPTLPLPSIVRVTNLDNGRVLNVRVNDRGPYKSSRIIDMSRRAAQLLGFYDVGTAHVRVEIDATESLNLKNLALKEHPPEMPVVIAAPRDAIITTSLAPVVASPNDIAPGSAPSITQSANAAPSASATAPDFKSITPGAAPAPANKVAPQKAAPQKAPVLKPLPKQETKIARANPGAEIPGMYVQAGAFSDPANAHRLEDQLKGLGNVVIVPVTVNNAQIYRVRLGPIADAAAAEAMLARVKGMGVDNAKVIRE